METQRVFKWFWAWDDEREEQWLTEMAQEGWHLQAPGTFGFYTFAQGKPRNVSYRLDFITTNKDKEEYLQLFADAGWEHLGAMGGWQYFRKEATGDETPEIYTDNESKVYKYQRLFFFLVIFLPIYLTMINNISHSPVEFVRALGLVFALFMLLYAYALVKLLLRIKKLKE